MSEEAMEEAIDASLDILRRINPKNVAKHLTNISKLHSSETVAQELLSMVDVPLAIKIDPTNNKPFLACDYNRDMESYRSPWSNKFYPELEEDSVLYPPADIRQLELQLNDSFDIYRNLYYEGGISSVYLWEQEDSIKEGFAGVLLLKKQNDDGSVWDSIHVLEISGGQNRVCHYQITTTIILDLGLKKNEGEDQGDTIDLSLSGNITRQRSQDLQINPNDLLTSHVVNIGSLIEDIESKLRNLLQEVYFGKTRDIIGDLRSLQSLKVSEMARERQGGIIQGLEQL